MPDPHWLCIVRARSSPYEAPCDQGPWGVQSEAPKASRPSGKSQLDRSWPRAEAACWCPCAGLQIAHGDVVAKLHQKTHGREPAEHREAGCRCHETATLRQCSSCTGKLHMALGIRVLLKNIGKLKNQGHLFKSWRKCMGFSRKNYSSQILAGNKILGLKSWLIQWKKINKKQRLKA